METYVFELPQKLNISIEISEMRFRLSCMDGDIDYAKKILSENANINNFDDAFFAACCEGHLHIAMWILSVKPTINISKYDNRALKIASYAGHNNIVEWIKNTCTD